MKRYESASPLLEILEARTLLATCNVTRLADTGVGMGFRGDLRYCINKTNTTPGQHLIEFRVTGTINLQSVLPNINDDLVIFGPGVNDLTVRRDTGGSYRVFTVNDGVAAEIYNLTVTNGTGGILNLGALTIAFAAVVNNNNTLVDGGGITNVGTLAASQVEITGNTTTISSGAKGGGIFNVGGATANISFATITGNTAANTNYSGTGGSGGGIFNQGDMVVEFSTISNNASTCKSDQNVCAPKGGGVANFGSFTLKYSTVDGNTTSAQHPAQDNAYGGGLYNNAAVTVDSSTISNNTVGGMQSGHVFGGGIAAAPGSTSTVINSTIANNHSPAFQDCLGGGISVDAATVNIHNSTIVGNTCFTEKFAANGGGIGMKGSSSVTIRNSILVGNFAETGGPEVHGILLSSGFNIFGDPSGGSGYDSTDQLFVDPMLGPLADNGGPTLTFALQPGSPAIDAGDNTNAPAFDQRGTGFPRVVNGTIDIGSFEVQTTAAAGRASEARPLALPAITHFIPRPQAAARKPDEATQYSVNLANTEGAGSIVEESRANRRATPGDYHPIRPALVDDPILFICFPV